MTAVKPVHLGRQKLVPGSRDAGLRLFHGLSLRTPLIFLAVFKQCDLIHDYRPGGPSADALAFHFRNVSSLTPGLHLIRHLRRHAERRVRPNIQEKCPKTRETSGPRVSASGPTKSRRGAALRASAALLQRADQSVSTTSYGALLGNIGSYVMDDTTSGQRTHQVKKQRERGYGRNARAFVLRAF